ncbi:MAG: response regulator [Hyphomicrobium sp.]
MPSIAIVNNEDWLRDFLARALKAEGYAVRTYANTADALTLCEQPADLAILDRTNPPLGGVELFRRLRCHTTMPVVFLSAWAIEIEESLRGTGHEAEGYMQLPFCTPELLQRVRGLIVP